MRFLKATLALSLPALALAIGTITPATGVPTGAPPVPVPVTCDGYGCASSFSAIPSCAQGPITTVASASGCGTNDYECTCSYTSAYSSTVISACGIDDALSVSRALVTACACVSSSDSLCPPRPTITYPPVTCNGRGCRADWRAVPDCGRKAFDKAAASYGCARSDHVCQCSASSSLGQDYISALEKRCGGINGAVTAFVAITSACDCVNHSTSVCAKSTSKR